MSNADLIEALEAAPEGSRELDRRINTAVTGNPDLPIKPPLSYFSTSIDAADSLRGEGWVATVHSPGSLVGDWHVLFTKYFGVGNVKEVRSRAKTEPLARSACALRAMEMEK